jgi:hypothetical protein
VHDALRQPSAPSLIVLYGPTGVGKTTLRLRLEQQLITEALPALDNETARVPVLAVEAIAPDRSVQLERLLRARPGGLERAVARPQGDGQRRH